MIVPHACKKPLAAGLGLALLMMAAPAGAQSQVAAPQPFTMTRTEVFTVRGAHQDPYRLSVSLPAAYEDASRRFPVIYVLDGDWYFGLAASTARLLEVAQELPPVIVVAIGYGGTVSDQRARRIREFTPDAVDGLEGSGHAGAFFTVLRNELVPAIESRYRTSGDRTLVGHSLGGLCAIFIAANAPALFQRVVIGSPALRTSAAPLIKKLTAATTHPPRIFLGLAAGDFPIVRDGYHALHQWLKTAPGSVRWTAEEFSGMTHQSVVGPLLARALPWIFSEK